jgi:hypothetical protein
MQHELRGIRKTVADKTIKRHIGKKLMRNTHMEAKHYSHQAEKILNDEDEESIGRIAENEGKHGVDTTGRFIKYQIKRRKQKGRAVYSNPGKTYQRQGREARPGTKAYSFGNPNSGGWRPTTSRSTYHSVTARPVSLPGRQSMQRQMIKANRMMATGAKTSGQKYIAKSILKITGRSLKAVGKGFMAIGKWLIPIILIGVLIATVVIILIAAVNTLTSPLGFFLSNDGAEAQLEEGAVTANQIVSTVNEEWLIYLRDLRQQYEDQGYVVNVFYNDNEYDAGGKINNWKDVLSLYVIAHSSRNKEEFLVLNDRDLSGIKSLYFEMNPVNVSTWIETIEREVEKEVERVVEHVRYKYNRSTGKLEKIVTYETVVETVTVIETEEIKHADIFVRNLRYPQVMDKYQVSDLEKEWIDAYASTEAQPYWEMLGIDFSGSEVTVPGDIDIIISNLPPGTKGSSIVQAAFGRLGDPYSMELRGTGKYVDCSYLTQWAYAQVGISIPGTAAEQARYCVENNKIVDQGSAQAGDLIFWAYPNKPRVANRFMQVGHVAIYVGNGMMIEAAPSASCVTYRAVSVQGTPIFYARPHV